MRPRCIFGDVLQTGSRFFQPGSNPRNPPGKSSPAKVVDFGANRKRVCHFLLVINSNLGPILHRFGDTAVYWSKNRQNRQFVPTPVSEIALARGDPNRISNHIFLETRMIRLSNVEEIMTLAFFVLIQYRSVTDGQTDGQTDGHSSSGYTSGLHSSLC